MLFFLTEVISYVYSHICIYLYIYIDQIRNDMKYERHVVVVLVVLPVCSASLLCDSGSIRESLPMRSTEYHILYYV